MNPRNSRDKAPLKCTSTYSSGSRNFVELYESHFKNGHGIPDLHGKEDRSGQFSNGEFEAHGETLTTGLTGTIPCLY